MQRIKIIKPTKRYKVGDIVELDNNEAFGLLDSGVAIISKDMTPHDYPTKLKPRKRNN